MDRYVIREPRYNNDLMAEQIDNYQQFDNNASNDVWYDQYQQQRASFQRTPRFVAPTAMAPQPYVMYPQNPRMQYMPYMDDGRRGFQPMPPAFSTNNQPEQMLSPAPQQVNHGNYEHRNIETPIRVNLMKQNRINPMVQPFKKTPEKTLQPIQQIQRKQPTPPPAGVPTPPPAGVDFKTEHAQNLNTEDKNKKAQNETSNELRVFSGNVENVLKWYKTVQDLNILCIYEITAKLMNIRKGDHSSKHMLVRNNSGPVLQVIYYEVDYMLPSINTGSFIRIVGRMVANNKLHAFSVRTATNSEVSTLPRYTALSNHALNKLATEKNKK